MHDWWQAWYNSAQRCHFNNDSSHCCIHQFGVINARHFLLKSLEIFWWLDMIMQCIDRYTSTPPPTHNYAELPRHNFNLMDMRTGGCIDGKRGKTNGVRIDSPLKDHWNIPESQVTVKSRTKYQAYRKTQQGVVSFAEYTDGKEKQLFKPNTADLQAVHAALVGPHTILPITRKFH